MAGNTTPYYRRTGITRCYIERVPNQPVIYVHVLVENKNGVWKITKISTYCHLPLPPTYITLGRSPKVGLYTSHHHY